MNNEWLWLIMLALNFITILTVYRFFGRIGLYAWLPISVIIANIQVIKTVELFGFTASLGNIVYATSFLATDILSENHGRNDARRAVGIGLVALISLTLFMNLALLFEPAAIDFAQSSMETLYTLLPRIALASFSAYAFSQINDVYLYDFLKKKHPGKQWIWLRNNLSTMISQAIDTLIFCTIAFAGSIAVNEFIEILISTYVLKWLVAALDTPLVYMARGWFHAGKIA